MLANSVVDIATGVVIIINRAIALTKIVIGFVIKITLDYERSRSRCDRTVILRY